MAQDDPYAAIAKPVQGQSADPYASVAKDQPAITPGQSEMLHDIGQAGVGAAKGLLHTVTSLPAAAGAGINRMLGYKQPESVTGREQQYAPTNTAQSIGRGVEQAGEFLVPGAGEEAIAAKAGRLAPLARVGYNALTTGALNKAQGGEFTTGALAGGAGSAIGQGLAHAAPTIAESAIGIGKRERGFEKSPGQAIINETHGIRPSTVEASAQQRLNELNPQLKEAAQLASVRTAPRPRGLLPPPSELHTPMSSYNEVFPEQLPNASFPAPRPEMGGPILPTFEPNRIASLSPARGVISGAQNQAIRENAENIYNQVSPMGETLRRNFFTGNPYPEKVTPAEMLDIRRGFNKLYGHWNPDTLPDTAGTARQAYHELTGEFHRAVPGTEELDQRISNLIPVVQRAESTSRNAPFIQRGLGRFTAHTGALTSAALGASEGRREGGLPGMLVGGTAGLLIPELVATPEGRMIAARAMASPTTRNMLGAPAKGAALGLFDRRDNTQ